MNRITFLLIWIGIAAGLFTFMAIAWRARKRRDAYLLPEGPGLSAPLIANFDHVGYVSTTPVGQPLVRVAIPGLSFKGWAEVAVHRDGVAIEVTGERRVEISADRVLGTGTARGRIGKVVERDGLVLLRWQALNDATDPALESSFRFASPAEQRRFTEAIAKMSSHEHPDETTTTTSTQEDA